MNSTLTEGCYILHSSFIIHHSKMCLEEYDRIKTMMNAE